MIAEVLAAVYPLNIDCVLSNTAEIKLDNDSGLKKVHGDTCPAFAFS